MHFNQSWSQILLVQSWLLLPLPPRTSWCCIVPINRPFHSRRKCCTRESRIGRRRGHWRIWRSFLRKFSKITRQPCPLVLTHLSGREIFLKSRTRERKLQLPLNDFFVFGFQGLYYLWISDVQSIFDLFFDFGQNRIQFFQSLKNEFRFLGVYCQKLIIKNWMFNKIFFKIQCSKSIFGKLTLKINFEHIDVPTWILDTSDFNW